MAIGNIIATLVTTIIMIPLNGLLLMLSTKIFKLKDQSYKTALKIALILAIVGFVFSIIGSLSPALAVIIGILSFIFVSVLLAVWLIKTNYGLDWGKALLVWLVWSVLSIVTVLIIGFIVGIIAVAIGFSAAAKAGLLGV